MPASLPEFNAMPSEVATSHLLSCCASKAWAEQIAAGRPYSDRLSLMDAARGALATMTWDDILEALSAHPRIGERADGQSQEATWSRREQATMQSATDDVRTALVQANWDYEERFGHIFLIFASGRSPQEMLDEVRRRMGNDPVAEQQEVRQALAQIALLRLERLLT